MSSSRELLFLMNHLPESFLFYFILNCHLLPEFYMDINKDISTQREHKLEHNIVEATLKPCFMNKSTWTLLHKSP